MDQNNDDNNNRNVANNNNIPPWPFVLDGNDEGNPPPRGLPIAVLAEPIHFDDDEDEDDGVDERMIMNPRRFPFPPAVAGVQAGALDNHDNEDQAQLIGFAQLPGRNIDTLSSYLFDMIRQDSTCNSVLSGWSRRAEGCNKVVEHCREHPEEAFYVSHHGRTPLHEACLRGSCTHIMDAILQANSMGVIDRDHQGNTPLHLLFVDFTTRSNFNSQQIDDIVGKILRYNPGFLASAVNNDGATALHMACKAPETMIDTNSLRQLIMANPSCASKLNNKNMSPLHLHCRRRNATSHAAKILIRAYADALTVLDTEEGWAPLHYAASNSNFELIRVLIQANPEAARVRSSNGMAPLHLLCQQNPTVDQLSAVELLIEADPDSITQRNHGNMLTPLHLICRGSTVSLPIIERLLETRPEVATIPDAEHYLPLHHVCEIGCDSQIVAALLRSYPSAAHAMTRKKDSALSLACTCNKSVEAVRFLIEANPGALVKKNDYGFAPLHCVCRAYQPRTLIVQALLDACPSCVTLKTHGGETPVHLACSNSGAFVGVLQLLTVAQNKQDSKDVRVVSDKPMTNKIGNTPLHDACFRGSPFEHIETLAMANPEWIAAKNNGGYSPLQILCKNGRIEERIVTTFSRIGGPEVFAVIDSTGNTPLHSAIREEMDVPTLKCLIRAQPDALHLKTIYGDSPLHLACFRRADPEVVRELALASSSGRLTPVLEPNSAGQTPIGIAMEEFRSVCRAGAACCVVSEYRPEQRRAFEVLAALVKILFYGPCLQDPKEMNLVRACVSLHRQDVRLDPAFIKRAIHLFPEEARQCDEEGNYPLHIEAMIPMEKMALLDASAHCCGGKCHKRMSILRMLLDVYPAATERRNVSGDFPLNLMIQNGRVWGHTVALALRAFPPALHWYKGLDVRILAFILERAGKECGVDTLFSLLTSSPDAFVGGGKGSS